MVFYTVTGVFACSAGGLLGAWFCGSLGFGVAGYEARGCLEDCEK